MGLARGPIPSSDLHISRGVEHQCGHDRVWMLISGKGREGEAGYEGELNGSQETWPRRIREPNSQGRLSPGSSKVSGDPGDAEHRSEDTNRPVGRHSDARSAARPRRCRVPPWRWSVGHHRAIGGDKNEARCCQGGAGDRNRRRGRSHRRETRRWWSSRAREKACTRKSLLAAKREQGRRTDGLRHCRRALLATANFTAGKFRRTSLEYWDENFQSAKIFEVHAMYWEA